MFVLFFPVMASAARDEVCFPLHHQSRSFKSDTYAWLSPAGRHTLYWLDDKETKISSLLLFDEKTGKYLKLTSAPYQKSKPWERQPLPFKFWGFSDHGSLVYWYEAGAFKVRRLSDGLELTAKTGENRKTLDLYLQDNFQMTILEEGKNLLTSSSEAGGETEEKPVYLRIVNFKTGRESRHLLHGFHPGCHYVTKDLSKLFFTDKSGSLYQTNLTEHSVAKEGTGEHPLAATVRLFGPVEGFDSLEENLESKCRFNELQSRIINFLKSSLEEGFHLRLPLERREFFIPKSWLEIEKAPPSSWLINDYGEFLSLGNLTAWEYYIQYPFFLVHSRLNKFSLLHAMPEEIATSYHIPSRRKIYSSDSDETSRSMTYRSNNAAVYIMRNRGEGRIQLLLKPFDLPRRKTLLDLSENEFEFLNPAYTPLQKIKDVLVGKTIWGEMFVLGYNKEIGLDARVFMPFPFEDNQFHVLLLYVSPSEILLFNGGFIGSDSVHLFAPEVHRWEMRCAEPSEDFRKNTASIEQSGLKDLTEESLFSLLAYTIKHPEIIQERPAAMHNLLFRVLLMSPFLYAHLHRLYPDLGNLPALDSLPSFVDERKEEAFAAVKAVLEQTVSSDSATRLSDWRFLRHVWPLLWEMPSSDRNFYKENITLSIINGALKIIPPLEDVFKSKLYYLIHPHVKELFREERRTVSDITVARHKQGFQTMILSSDQIRESEGRQNISTDFGLHYVVLEDAERNDLADVKNGEVLADAFPQWRAADGKRYRAHVHIKADFEYGSSVDDLIPALSQPDYGSIWADGKMTGLMAVGSGMRHISQYLAEEYIAYLEEEGFQFSGSETGNLKSFFWEKVKNCELDYFIKHGHGAGDERNIMRLDSFNYVVHAFRRDEVSGREEEIYLVLPPASTNTEIQQFMLTTLDMSEAMRERDWKGCRQFTMLNITCWSAGKAVYESGAIRYPGFLNIVTRSPAEAFENRKDSAPRAVFDSFRKGLDFDGFREALQVNEGYRKGKESFYTFPDEPAYRENVVGKMKVPMDIKIELEVKEGDQWVQKEPDEVL